ncbi:FAD-dependent oxidoreductase [uncultured Sphingomonas sp.]|uniref:FAD-dependent oxidoreductase n=1 Tax=uncultured Sphingomonas sp. TaxID=158754 RepID=UPI00261E4F06|nr:FAD-dependent oxidoreductase [uncultured Sphingomonas sp.]
MILTEADRAVSAGPARMRARSIIVIGAGVVGVATAYALARRGAKVILIDRAETAGRGTSYANGAQLSYVYTDALANPALLKRIPALLIGLDPVFRLRPSVDPAFFGWLLGFLRNASSTRFRSNTIEGLRLGLESRRALHSLLERHPIAFDHAAPGKLHIHEHPASLAAARAMAELKGGHGAIQHCLTRAEVVAIEPALAARRGAFAGAIYTPDEEVGDPYLFCNAMLAVLRRDYAVDIRLETNVAAIDGTADRAVAICAEGERIEADEIVLCTGIDTMRLLRGTGISAPILPMKGYSFTAPAGAAMPKVSITDVVRKIVFCRLGTKLRVAGLAELGVHDTTIDARRLDQLRGSSRAVLPDAANYDAAHGGWAGLRPVTPSSLPIIRRARSRISLNVGHGMLGWTFAMGSAERVARMILGEDR